MHLPRWGARHDSTVGVVRSKPGRVIESGGTMCGDGCTAHVWCTYNNHEVELCEEEGGDTHTRDDKGCCCDPGCVHHLESRKCVLFAALQFVFSFQ